MQYISPAFSESKVAIGVSSSNEYAPFLSVFIKSIIENSSEEKKYDIIVFESSISDCNKKKLLSMINKKNISLRFFDPSYLFDENNLYISHWYFKKECYYRIASPVILKNYDKVIYTDLDLVLQDDILKLADIDLNGKAIAACKEVVWEDFINSKTKIMGIDIVEYSTNILKLKDISTYFNTGVVVIDIAKYNELNSFHNILEIVTQNKLLYQEQCGINMFFNDRIHVLEHQWNFEIMPETTREMQYSFYMKALQHAKILHFLGSGKPWFYPEFELCEMWWKYARTSPFYEEIIGRMVSHKSSHLIHSNIKEFRLSYVMNHPLSFIIKRLRYYLLKHITSGDSKVMYQQKYKAVSQLIRDAKKLRKQWTKF